MSAPAPSPALQYASGTFSTAQASSRAPAHLFQVYPVSDALVLLEAASLSLVRTLAFWEAFPGLMGAGGKIRCFAVDRASHMVRVVSLSHNAQ